MSELDPRLLLQGYATGIFPMADSRDADELFWVEPKNRAIIPLDGFHVSRSLRRTLRSGRFDVTHDRDFAGVIAACADREQTWINAELERAMTRLFDRFGGMGFAQLRKVDQREFREFGREFGEVVRSLPFQLPENFLLVIRSMSLTSGVCSSLDPEFNIWDAIEPYATQLMRKESGNVAAAVAREVLSAAGIALRLPGRIDQLITRIDQGVVTVATPAIDRRLGRLERLARRAVGSVLFAGLLIGGVLLIPTAAPLAVALMCASAIPLLYVLFGRT